MASEKAKDVVLREFPPVGKYRVRLIKPDEKSPPVLDVREYVTGATFEGFTRRGIKLAADQLAGLAETLEAVKDMLSGRGA